MAFFKFRLRGQSPESVPASGRASGRASAKSSSSPTETVETLRRRARYRLVGAAVLVAVAVIVFPLLFDTRPRPVAMDVPITIPEREKVAPLESPSSNAHSGQVSHAASLDSTEEVVPDTPRNREAQVVPAARVEKPAEPVFEKPAEKSVTKVTEKPVEKAIDKPAEKPIEKPAAKHVEKPAEKPVEKEKTEKAPERKAAEPPSRSDDAARARALLEGRVPEKAPAVKPEAKPQVAAAGERVVIQIGAFSDASAARDVRAKAERAGVKTYTQEIKTDQGKSIVRVRVGPFSSREDAEKAAAALKRSGLSASILSL